MAGAAWVAKATRSVAASTVKAAGRFESRTITPRSRSRAIRGAARALWIARISSTSPSQRMSGSALASGMTTASRSVAALAAYPRVTGKRVSRVLVAARGAHAERARRLVPQDDRALVRRGDGLTGRLQDLLEE